MDTLVLHTTRGIMQPQTLDEARALHNAFVGEGPQPGIEIARSLGDVSHEVYAALGSSGAEAGELLFLDCWTAPEGMEMFFADPFAQQAGDRLYSSRAEAEWHPAPGAVSLQFPAQAGAPARFVVLVQASPRSADAAVAALDEAVVAGLGPARRRGQLSHQLFVRHPDELGARPASNARHGDHPAGAGPRAAAPAEVLAMSFWPTLDGLREHHRDPATVDGLEQAVAGPVAISVWEQAGGFVEW